MLPPAVVEQQAKLGVSAEDSKTHRLKRQRARFRDRGGVFVPSNSNPLIDILLARTVSGESPSKARPKDVAARRRSSSKPKTRQSSPIKKVGTAAITEQVQSVPGSSKSKSVVPRKRKSKAVELESEVVVNPAPKRRGRPTKGKKVPEPDTELPPSKATSKGKGKQRAVVSSIVNEKPKRKAKAKPSSTKEVVEVLVSDDETLVEVPRKAKSDSQRKILYENSGKTVGDAPTVKKRDTSHLDKISDADTSTRVRTETLPQSTGSSRKKALEDVVEGARDRKRPKTNVKKQRVPQDADDDVAAALVKKGKIENSISLRTKSTTEPNVTGSGKGMGKAEPDRNVVNPGKEDDQHPPEYVTKPRKRKKEDNYDDRPCKVVKFSEPDTLHASSQKLKENQSDGKRKSVIDKYEPQVARSRPVAKPSSYPKTSKGPPREVLERIKATAARYMRCADSEPDELDCLS